MPRRGGKGRRKTLAERLAETERQRDDALHQADMLALEQSATFNDALRLRQQAAELTAASESQAPATPAFDPVEKAVALMRRDIASGQPPRSTREYAKLVGRHHSRLSRSPLWRQAMRAMVAAAQESRAARPRGRRTESGLEAQAPDE